MKQYILAIDQGTSSSRAIIFDVNGNIVAKAQQTFAQTYPQDGWIEQDPQMIWQTVEQTCQQALAKAQLNAKQIAAIGISNQRETTLIWHKHTGEPVYPAIVWQDRRTAKYCQQLAKTHGDDWLQAKTGLLFDPYFSASKIQWVLDNVEGVRAQAERGDLLFGTVDSFLIWRLTEGNVHATDATNASRTALFNLQQQCWDQELIDLFTIPIAMLPQVKNSSDDFGNTSLFGANIPITGVAGDQQAAAFGQTCFQAGMMKSTYGTGCFLLLNTGQEIILSKNRLLSTVAYRLNNQAYYALEGSIFIAGAAVQWLRDTAHLIGDAGETEAIANSIEDSDGVYLVPAFTGLGAPYWDPLARGAILGLTRHSGAAHIIRAALEAVCYQSKDLLLAMQKDSGITPSTLRVDGGMVNNNWLVQFLSDILALPVQRPTVTETSVLGAAYLAGLGVGCYTSLAEIAKLWQVERHFVVQMPAAKRQRLYQGWLAAVERILSP